MELLGVFLVSCCPDHRVDTKEAEHVSLARSCAGDWVIADSMHVHLYNYHFCI